MTTTDLMIDKCYDINCELQLDTNSLIRDIQAMGNIKSSTNTVVISRGRRIGILVISFLYIYRKTCR
jgi:hypothetical protein